MGKALYLYGEKIIIHEAAWGKKEGCKGAARELLWGSIGAMESRIPQMLRLSK